MSTADPITAPRLVTLEPQRTVAVRVQTTLAGLPAAFDQWMPAVTARATTAGGAIAGPPFARYHQFSPQVVDVEIGIPVSSTPSDLPKLANGPAAEIGAS